jgi:hypothetical protein
MMDYKTLLARTQEKMAVFLDRRVAELIDGEFRGELESLAEKICFTNLVNQYRRRKLAIPIEIEKRLLHERTERFSAKIERRTAAAAQGEVSGILPQTQPSNEDGGH